MWYNKLINNYLFQPASIIATSIPRLKRQLQRTHKAFWLFFVLHIKRDQRNSAK